MKYTTKIYIVLLIVLLPISSYSQKKPDITLIHDDGFDTINSLSYSLDGTRIITCAVNGMIWDTLTGEKIQTIVTDGIGCAAFSPDNKMIVGGRSHLLTRIWDIETGNLVYSKQGPGEPSSFDYPLSIFGVSFLTYGQEAIIIDQYGKIEKWNYKNNEIQSITEIDMAPYQEIQVSNDGNQLFVNPFVISIPKRRIIHTFENSTVYNFKSKTAFSLRVSGGSYQTYNLEVYDTDTFKMINEYPPFTHYGRQVRLHPEGQYVLAGKTGVRDEETQFIDAHNSRVCKTFQNAKGEDENIDKIVFSPNGKQVALVSGNRIKLYDVSDLTSNVKEAEALGR